MRRSSVIRTAGTKPLPEHETQRGKTASLIIVLLAQVAAMGVWFSSTTAIAVIKLSHTIAPFEEALLTSAVQLGFVAGTIASALLS
ncbi:MAG TPA: MFS transporter, partial [Paraburkholderia sp.]|nr:MFS transporter [Paraburkholderia sp.]